jgi:hypothetical protein
MRCHYLLIPEVHRVPVGLEIPQGEEEENIMQVERKLYLVEFGHHLELIPGPFFEFVKRHHLESCNLGHEFLCFIEVCNGHHLIVFLRESDLIDPLETVELNAVTDLDVCYFFIPENTPSLIKLHVKGEGGVQPAVNRLIHLLRETVLDGEIDKKVIPGIGHHDIRQVGLSRMNWDCPWNNEHKYSEEYDRSYSLHVRDMRQLHESQNKPSSRRLQRKEKGAARLMK